MAHQICCLIALAACLPIYQWHTDRKEVRATAFQREMRMQTARCWLGWQPAWLVIDRSHTCAPHPFDCAGLHLVAGSGCYLYSSSGSAFLDCVNNVTHVGHSHPHVTQRINEQQRLINTNSVMRN